MISEPSRIEPGEEYVSHPLLVDDLIEAREYQVDLVRESRESHTLITLPTGLGKTTVSLLLTAERLHEHGGKVLFLAPTKPLVRQHASFYREALDIFDDQITVFTGDVRPAQRAELWDDSTIVIATPQVVENDLVAERISLEEVVHCTFDECHRASGDYAYNFIADRYHAQASTPLVTAMSASPGEDKDGILAVCENLGITNIEVRTENDPAVEEYTYRTEVDWEEISLPEEILEIRDAIQDVIKDRMTQLKEMGVASSATKDPSQSDLNRIRGKIQDMMDNDNSKGYKAMSVHAEVDKLTPAVQTIESQGVDAFVSYMERNIIDDAKSSGGSKASKRLADDPKINEALRRARNYSDPHPKLLEARRLVINALKQNSDSRVLIFTESRDTAELLTDFLSDHFDAHRFVGQTDKENSPGMTQSEQKQVMEDFKAGEYEVLVSTSVSEEGIDVPAVDLVLFYEPVPESVRTIQRKGRTGRHREGKVIVLVGADTRDGVGGNTIDETYYWISQRRQRQMQDEIEELQDMESDIQELLDDTRQTGLDAYTSEEDEAEPEIDAEDVASDVEPDEEDVHDETTTGDESPAGDDVEVVIDQREMDSGIPRHLTKMGDISTRVETLEVGDFILSDRVAVERKEVSDFLSSLIESDRDVFQQIKEISNHYERPVMIVEGDDLYGQRNIHPNAIRAALSSLAVDFNVSVLRTRDEEDTAELLETIAVREQEDTDTTVSLHGQKETKTLAEQQEYVVSSIVDIGPVTARSLLEHFDTVRDVMNADKDELQSVEGIGEVTAEQIHEVVTSSYDPDA